MSETGGLADDQNPAQGNAGPGREGDPLGAGYRLFDRLGGGAMGEVRQGRTSTGEAVAVKILRPEFVGDPSIVARFLQERSILTGLSHPNIVQVRDLVAEGQTLAIVMELVEGPDLRTEIAARGALPPAEAAALTAGVLRGLAVVHEAGVVHRDLKPENVLLERSGDAGATVPKVTDFGISKLAEQKPSARRTSVIGTPDYMAPELIDDSQPTVSSDLYGVGIMLYELLTGVTPFMGGSPLSVLRKHAELPPGRPAGIPDSLWGVIADLLSKDPAQRPTSASAVADRLDAQMEMLAPIPALATLREPPSPDAEAQTQLKSIATGSAKQSRASSKGSQKRVLAVVAAVLLLTLAGIAVFATTRGSDAGAVAPTPTAAVSESVSLTASPTASDSLGAIDSPTAVDQTDTTQGSTAPVGVGFMPDVVGERLSEATAALAAAGVEFTQTDVIDTSVTDGTVIAQSPSAGDSVDGMAELRVARHSQTVWLSDQAPIVGSPGPGPVDINGRTYVHALTSYVRCDSTITWEYDLGRAFTSLRGSVGLTDDSDSADKVQVEIYRDGVRIFNRRVSLGHPSKFNVDVTDGLRLKLFMKTASCGNTTASYLAFVNARLSGLPSSSTTAP